MQIACIMAWDERLTRMDLAAKKVKPQRTAQTGLRPPAVNESLVKRVQRVLKNKMQKAGIGHQQYLVQAYKVSISTTR